jgi:hypothetical protein
MSKVSAVQAALGHSDIRETQRYAKVAGGVGWNDFIGLSHFEAAPKMLPFKSLTSAAAL